jgi:hypothetical protein
MTWYFAADGELLDSETSRSRVVRKGMPRERPTRNLEYDVILHRLKLAFLVKLGRMWPGASQGHALWWRSRKLKAVETPATRILSGIY